MNQSKKTIKSFVAEQNQRKLLFTAGPASLLPENITGLRPCFGRGDEDYDKVEQYVLDRLRTISGQRNIARLQGSASLALEILALNFLYGRVLIVSTGYYSDRIQWLADSAKRRIGEVKEVVSIPWRDLGSVTGQYDWIFSCYVETSCGLKVPIDTLVALSKKTKAKLILDATASISLEDGHEAAHAVAFSSCKGLFGLTGAAFVAFNEYPSVDVDSFYLRLDTHLNKLMTGPYHTICSLLNVLPNHDDYRAAVMENKRLFSQRMKNYLTLAAEHQPLLCTHVNCEISGIDTRAILYKPRRISKGSVVCHLGEVHCGRQSKGQILEALECTTIPCTEDGDRNG